MEITCCFSVLFFDLNSAMIFAFLSISLESYLIVYYKTFLVTLLHFQFISLYVIFLRNTKFWGSIGYNKNNNVIISIILNKPINVFHNI